MSFFRQCKTCGEKISFRQMPAGQWVAFDPGTDDPHVCRTQRKRLQKERRKLDLPGTELAMPEQVLAKWENAPEYRVNRDWLSCDEIGRMLSYAIKEGVRIEIIYSGGSTPMNRRIIEPLRMYEKTGFNYVESFCNLRKERRTFRLDRVITARIIDPKQKTSSTTPPMSIEHKHAVPQQNTYSNERNKSTLDDAKIAKGIPGWVWIIGIIFLFYFCSK